VSTSVNALPTVPIAVEERVLEDLRSRLRATKWPDDDGNEDGRYGVPRALLQELAEYWAGEYDWRAAERAMNAYEHYVVDVSGTRVHFMRKPGAGPAPVPLILSHGWPWTFWHWSKVIDRLADPAAFGGDPADAFEVIVPSLPGFGYSTPTRPDMNFWKIADVWHELMTETLGHARYAAAGCDVGALVTGQLGHKYAGELYGIHIGSALSETRLLHRRPRLGLLRRQAHTAWAARRPAEPAHRTGPAVRRAPRRAHARPKHARVRAC
jgi:pimeloyl-ACP methyl ester carboxylesterase